MIGKSWRTRRVRIVPFFAFPEGSRRGISTTNAIESLNNYSLFPSDEAVCKLRMVLWAYR